MAHICICVGDIILFPKISRLSQDFHDFLATRDLNQPPDGRHLGMDEDEGGDPPHAWDQDPDIKKALEGTATDQVQAMAVSTTKVAWWGALGFFLWRVLLFQ